MEIPIYNQAGEKAGTMEVPEDVFGLKWNEDLMQQVIQSYAANMRRPVAHAKGRGEVRGGGKKPWRQKGTGRARHGSIRSPIWKGGGVTHGPLKEKIYKKKINKKMAQIALKMAMSAKARDKEFIVLEGLSFPSPKTKEGQKVFNNLVKTFPNLSKGNGALVALREKNTDTERAIRNLSFVKTDNARNLNAWQILQYKYLVMPKEAVEALVNKS